ncbi:MAG TPA: polysaccharide biosynthesis/export family protein [Vicinamibacterales bacterium]|nr:polysaccharide biosynthesis/export family protein [Vicinamibacterales bacterium]
MKLSVCTVISFLFLLSTASAQQPPRPVPDAAARAGAAGAPPAPAAPPATTPEYRLHVGDKLRVDVYKDPNLSQSLQIRPDGKITLPLVGDIEAAGKSPLELRDTIAGTLKDYIASPVVTVIVVETVPQVVYVMGEVNKPGTLALGAGGLSVLQALAVAGGFKDFADKKDIRILRGSRTLHFNYKDAVKGEGSRIVLQPGDTIIVP